MAVQNTYATMEWTTDNNKMSVHHMKHILTPKKAWNDYKKGDTGTAEFPGYPNQTWEFIIHNVGASKKDLDKELKLVLEAEKRKFQGISETNNGKKDKGSKEKEKKGNKKTHNDDAGQEKKKNKKDQGKKGNNKKGGNKKEDEVAKDRREKKKVEIEAMKEMAKTMTFAKSKTTNLAVSTPATSTPTPTEKNSHEEITVVDDTDDCEDLHSPGISTDEEDMPRMSYEGLARVARKRNLVFVNERFGNFLDENKRKQKSPRRQLVPENGEEDHDYYPSDSGSDSDEEIDNAENETQNIQDVVENENIPDVLIENVTELPMASPAKQARLIEVDQSCHCAACPYKERAMELQRQVTALKMKLSRGDSESLGCQAMAGLMSPEIAKANKMVEIMPSTSVFITQKQLQSVVCSVATRTKLATRLLRCFHSSEELKTLKTYKAVDPNLRDAIESCACGLKTEETKSLPAVSKNKIKKALSNHVTELLRNKRQKIKKSKKNPEKEPGGAKEHDVGAVESKNAGNVKVVEDQRT